jgi:hypothetical protein
VFKLGLLGVHIAWLIVNLAAVAHFIATTLKFVQQSEREQIRERYIANIVMPVEMTERLRLRLYEQAGIKLIDDDDENGPLIFFGPSAVEADVTELEKTFSRPKVLRDVRVLWVRWALRRWFARCQVEAPGRPLAGLAPESPTLVFAPHPVVPLRGRVAWCRRRGGVALNKLERAILRWSFLFKRAPYET